MAEGALGYIDGVKHLQHSEGLWTFDDDDWALMAMLQDPVYCAELLFDDPRNREYSGCYHVIDYQYPLFRPVHNYEGFPCARSVGKTESMKARGVAHYFRRQGEDMVITAPELIHLDPLGQAIESRIVESRLLDDLLQKRDQRTGFNHKSGFEITYADGTKIKGRIPKLSGTGVKGLHEPDLMIEEAQDYPERGWTELTPTLMRDHVDAEGNPDFTMSFYGVHSATTGNDFDRLTKSGEYKITTITRLMTPGWGPAEKRALAAMYGGTTSPDYRRNVLGEAGHGAHAFFVTSRLFACVDQDRDSRYNTIEFKRQALRAEDVDKIVRKDDPEYTVGNLLDLPEGLGQQVFVGGDLGLVNDPTVITVWAVLPDTKKRTRLKLVRMFHLWEFREKMIRQCFYAIAHRYGRALRGVGLDVTGLGLPLFQAMEDDEVAPKHLLEVTNGYVFNAKLPIGVDKTVVSDDGGRLRDQYGNIVEEVEDPFTGEKRYVVYMSMIEASTRYLREWVDTGELMLPFDSEIVSDMQGETEQRVRAMAGSSARKKVSSFHILDSMRGMAMVRKHEEVMSQVAAPDQRPVLDRGVESMA